MASVAVLGLGLMGGRMSIRLAKQGHEVHVWNRNAKVTEQLIKECPSLRPAGSVQQAIQESQVIVPMLSDAAAISEVLLQEAVKSHLCGRVVVQMSTIGPNESVALAGQVEGVGAEYMEAPVLGSRPEADAGALQVFVGCAGDPKLSPAWSVLCSLSTSPRIMGPVGSASAMKLALNQLIVIETLGFSASLGLVQRTGGDVDTFMEVLKASALFAPTFEKKLSKYLSRDFGAANFPTKHLLKDARLFCSEAEALGMATDMQRAAEKLCLETLDLQGGKFVNQDYSAVYEAVVYPERPAKH